MLTALTVEVDRFTGGAGNATYRRAVEGHYERAAGTLDAVPEMVDADEPLVVALRTDAQPLRCADAASRLPGALALPMSHRGELDGFVLVGSKVNNEIYRPDEVELLALAANQAGHDFHALQAEAFRREAAVLRATNQEMRTLVELALAGQGALKSVD